MSGNATYLFRTPSDSYHHSESFWASLMAIALLVGSRSTGGIHVPAFVYHHVDKRWWFEQSGALHFTQPLEWRQVVVEGRIRRGFIAGLDEVPPQRLWDLRPDLVIQTEHHVGIIEVKTVGHELGRYQKECCENLAVYLNEKGYEADLFFLISAGHECRKDWSLLLNVSPPVQSFRLLLWERDLRLLTETEPLRALATAIPNIPDYFTPEDLYMGGLEA
jgi:hypothetical protein